VFYSKPDSGVGLPIRATIAHLTPIAAEKRLWQYFLIARQDGYNCNITDRSLLWHIIRQPYTPNSSNYSLACAHCVTGLKKMNSIKAWYKTESIVNRYAYSMSVRCYDQSRLFVCMFFIIIIFNPRR